MAPLQPKHQPGNDLAGDVVASDDEATDRPRITRLRVDLLDAADRERQLVAHEHVETGREPQVTSDVARELDFVKNRADMEGRRKTLPRGTPGRPQESSQLVAHWSSSRVRQCPQAVCPRSGFVVIVGGQEQRS